MHRLSLRLQPAVDAATICGPRMVLADTINLDSNQAKAYIAIAVGVLGLGYLWLRSISRKRSDPLERAPFAGLSQQRAVERQFQSLLVEMAEMSRQISAQLDTRSEKLNQLIVEADAKIAELRQLQSRAAPQPAQFRPAAEVSPPSGANNDAESRYAEIYSLAEQGFGALEIARKLDRPRGEVELILALRTSPAGQPQRAVG